MSNMAEIPKDLQNKDTRTRGLMKLGGTVASVAVIALTALTIAAALSNPITATALALVTIFAVVIAHDSHKVGFNMTPDSSSRSLGNKIVQHGKNGLSELTREFAGNAEDAPRVLDHLDGTWLFQYLVKDSN